jgi:ABC transport system ATP-binding/permease protein
MQQIMLGMVTMNILSAENVSKSYGDKVLLDCVSFGIDDQDKIGLIGVNGTGKSTLLKMVAGVEHPESGTVILGSRVTVHYLPQEPVFDPTSTVLDQVFHGEAPVMKLLREYQHTLDALTQSPEDRGLQTKLLRLQSQLDELDAWQLEHEAKVILTKLGITDFHAVVGTLSGGQRKRIALASALIQPADLLVLDEPTNHIDNESVQWLETYLQKRKGALLMVTHDRYFLDRVVNRIFELDKGKLYRYPGNYQVFLEAKLEREAQQRASEEKRQNFLRNELEWVRRGPKARGTKQKARTERFYEVLEQTPDTGPETLEFAAASSRLGRTVIELDHVSKAYAGKSVIRDFSYIVMRNDRIGIVGPNGSGKTTLMKMMAGRLTPDSGVITIGSTVKIGYFSQEHDEMNGQQRVIDYIRDEVEYVVTEDGHTISAAQMLERFLFPGPLQWTPIAKLSGGEKRRLALLKTLMAAPNVLLLDEPTNDLDIPTLSVLESYLDEFPGAVIVVSHDRYFLDRVAQKVFAFEGGGQVSTYFGNFSDYLAQRPEEESEAPSEKYTEKTEKRSRRSSKPTIRKFTFKEQKEYDEIEDRIAEVEQSLSVVTQQMDEAGGDYGRLQALYEEQQALEERLNELLDRWTYLNEIAEEMEHSRKSERG